LLQAVAEFGHVDGLLHNAGISTLVPLAEITDKQWDQMLRVHLYGAFYLTRAAWPHLARRRGRILYISSAVGFYGVSQLAHYGAAKAGMIGLSRVAATEGRANGIAVNLLGVAASTRMMDLAMTDSPKMTQWFAKYMKPNLPSAAAVWLLHPQCPTSGHIFEAFGPHLAEVFIAETSGYTKFGTTAEDCRDNFDKIMDRAEFFVPDGPDDFHARTFEFIVKAGAEPLEPESGTATLAVQRAKQT
jgi:NAD(P)-dependent dehydrogenase (short-subunit alcohol dehydrogenase family)